MIFRFINPKMGVNLSMCSPMDGLWNGNFTKPLVFQCFTQEIQKCSMIFHFINPNMGVNLSMCSPMDRLWNGSQWTAIIFVGNGSPWHNDHQCFLEWKLIFLINQISSNFIKLKCLFLTPSKLYSMATYGNHIPDHIKPIKNSIYEMDPVSLCLIIRRKTQVYGMDLPHSFYGMEVPT